MGRVGGIGKGEVGREVPAATELCVRDELVQPIEEPEESGSGLGATGQRLLVPREVLLGGSTEHRRDQAVLAAEVLVERPAGDVRLLQQRVDSDRSALGVEELAARSRAVVPEDRALLVAVMASNPRLTIDRPFYTFTCRPTGLSTWEGVT